MVQSHRNFFTNKIRRAKLYIYSESLLDKGTGSKTWNDKGVGEMKLLKYVCIKLCITF